MNTSLNGGWRLTALAVPAVRSAGSTLTVVIVAAVAITTAGLTTVAAARQAPAAGQAAAPAQERPAPSDNLPPVTTGELVNMLDTYAIVKAQDELALNDTQYGQFVSRLKRLQEVRRRNQRARNQILQDLRKLSGPQAALPIDENALRERLRALREHDDRAAAEMRKAYETLDEVLNVRQQARFRAFEETIERRKLDLMLRARERAARGGR
jgi:hypothetical protein